MDTQNPGNKKSFGPIVWIAIVVVLVILGALYFWGGKLTVSESSPETQTASVAPLLASDDTGSIESDLNASTSAVDVSNF